MFGCHPIQLTAAPQEWQVLPQKDGFAVFRIEGTVRREDVRGEIYYRVVFENNGSDVLAWTPVSQHGDTFSAELRLPVGGPYRVETCAKPDELHFKDAIGGQMCRHLFVGDLYLIAGQSNAVGFARDTAYDPPCIGVSVLRLSGAWALASHPLHDGSSNKFCNLDVPLPAQSPWLTFAKTVYQKTGIPIGLLPAALGGSPLEAWMPGACLYENALAMVKAGGAIRGVLWYQGCADALALKTETYLRDFLQTVKTFRQTLGDKTLPFFTCQLNGFTEPGEGLDEAFAALRQAQAEAANGKGIYLLPTAGLPLYDQIHNSAASNCRIGRQIAAMVLASVYGIDCRHTPPKLTAVAKIPNGLVLTVSPLAGTLRMKKSALRMFAAFRDGKPLPVTNAYIQDNKLYLCGEDLHCATQLQYAQKKDLTAAGIYDSAGGWMLPPFIQTIGK